ncbi:MAG: His/Gly/Thr/Pro-type tRNA ligase C-terminal domain-containing protein, partial [Patescibacteria group bacterium]
TKFTDAFEVDYADEEGKKQRVVMGCFGIGPSRVMGSIVEAHHDDRGIIWPLAVAPFPVHLVMLSSRSEETQKKIEDAAEKLYSELQSCGIDVLWDDRLGVSAGEKFGDSDLIGIPLRLVISEKTLEKDSVEWKVRGTDDMDFVPTAEVVVKVKEFVK